MSIPVVQDGRRARGDASRRIVLHSATDLASVEGLDGLTIGRLAQASGSSKSSIATLFRSKEGLQLATVEAAREIFTARVVEPARECPRGVHRLAALLRNSLAYSKDRVFTGGCFFAATAADVDSKSGPVSDAVRAALVDWYGYIEAQLRHAVAAEEIDADAEVLAFELVALNEHANAHSLLMDDDRPYALAAAAMRGRLRAAGAEESAAALLDL
ncbi:MULTISPECIES: TetR/AcrR family transcriptional regulator [Microbacterium]|uniref:TetR/AcrR family transcriptional regulator n=2 Tax=Microbacterium maritypicum TaxID=33918 RepID=A0ACD4B5G2_MICMQ|nr:MULTISPECIES: TetR/AcrR family transcriptional regulator [Microbacterium]EYT60461.1 transcriptional regulator [Microbacterium sp. UCD-TDU]UTT52760.1 TetR/AcrR family transcriptional regulator [Microbacterium liquefaciens]WEF20805.1 TetR/AcrR family transcriptional regulator [Microbacterium liquefaciens]